jgi:hypothetical protein
LPCVRRSPINLQLIEAIVGLEARIDRLRECAGTKSTSKRRKEDADLAELGDQWNPPCYRRRTGISTFLRIYSMISM